VADVGATAAPADAPQPVAFVVRRPGARAVALVGDFNRWDVTATPMRRLPDGTWTAEVPLTPGRHGYSFVVDGATWVLDPRAPVARDADFGRDHSVIVVGLP
jgi:1,4-alpha-glucan branching enzyme